MKKWRVRDYAMDILVVDGAVDFSYIESSLPMKIAGDYF